MNDDDAADNSTSIIPPRAPEESSYNMTDLDSDPPPPLPPQDTAAATTDASPVVDVGGGVGAEYRVDDDDDDGEHHHSLPEPPDHPVYKRKEANLAQTLAGLSGNILEWYDFALFGYFSDIIGDVFFPAQDGNAAIIESFMIFGSAFLFRPIGGMLMGYIGDKYGRKLALELSIMLMALPTFLMGCLPSYASVGWASTIALTAIRIFQGLSVGGQLMSSLIYTVEGHPKSKWGLYGSYVMAASSLGTLMGSFIGMAMRSLMTYEQLVNWGWRLPFLGGILVGFSAFYLKYHCEEEHSGAQISQHEDVNPIKAAFARENRRSLFAASMVPMLWACGFYITFVWMAVFMEKLIPNPVNNAFAVNSMALLISDILIFPVIGHWSDLYGRTKLMKYGGVGIAILGPVMVRVIGSGSAILAFFGQCVLGFTLSLYGAPMCAWLAESFPPEVRLTAVSIGYNIAHAVLGGFSPAIATVMVDKFGVNSPGFLYTIVAVLSLVGLFTAPVHEVVNEGDDDEITIVDGDEKGDVAVENRSLTADGDYIIGRDDGGNGRYVANKTTPALV
eukprot:CAMPEP_0172487384 /NCGR_PEP_ID=MMETSP1066-20121228/16471_1 /TAXON_ID=671091 /ORGANISM="Coscinodiscus wailesii, Strain CCMP2513" /LENGTH=559 /DNA_ID=CAMNT_0013253975 /DNA_START=139 /DNA_END=1818 /DNA_ORIENTATION=+